MPTTVAGHDLSRTHPLAHLSSWDLHQFRSNPAGGLPRSQPDPRIGMLACSHWFLPVEGKASTNRSSRPEMAVSPRRTRMQVHPHLVRTGTRMDMGASLLWDRTVLMGRIQHSIHPTRSCMGSKRMPAPMEQAAPQVLWLVQEQWEFMTTKSRGRTSMMVMVESDEDSGPPSVAEPDPLCRPF